jgi:two-component system, response regulator PdtaR
LGHGRPETYLRPGDCYRRHERTSRSLRTQIDSRGGTETKMLFGKRERRINRILLVEDEPLVAFDNEHLLTDAGYEVVATVDNLEAAREIIENQALDLVVTDIRLNGDGDGTGVARIAKGRNVPVLFVTAFASDEAPSLGIGCLAKPYSNRVLKGALDAVDDHLQGRKLKRLPPQLTLYSTE